MVMYITLDSLHDMCKICIRIQYVQKFIISNQIVYNMLGTVCEKNLYTSLYTIQFSLLCKLPKSQIKTQRKRDACVCRAQMLSQNVWSDRQLVVKSDSVNKAGLQKCIFWVTAVH